MQSNIAKNSLNQLLNVSYSITPENKSIENGKYHDYNRLNNLTSKEWLKFQKSWFIVNPKPRQKNLLFHPAKFPDAVEASTGVRPNPPDRLADLFLKEEKFVRLPNNIEAIKTFIQQTLKGQ